LQLALRVDVPGHVSQDIDLRLPERGHRRADLPVEIGQLEVIEIGDVELADSEPRQRRQIEPADTAHAGDRDTLVSEALLLAFRQPADVAIKGSRVVEPRTGDSAGNACAESMQGHVSSQAA